VRDDMIKHALGECGVDADSPAIAHATVNAMTGLLKHLEPLSGELASRALYVRSLHLARSSFIKPDVDRKSPGDFLTPLQQDLSNRPPAEARAAAEALLLALADLLASLIGDSLTARLLHKSWDIPAASTSAQENLQ